MNMVKKFFKLSLIVPVIAGVAIFYFLNLTTLPTPQVNYRQTPETGEMIVVYFSSSVPEDKALKSFSISPAIPGDLQWLSDYNELQFIPFEGFEPNKSYTVHINRSSSLFAQVVSNTTKKTFQPKGLPTRFNARVPGDSTIYYVTELGLKRPVTLEVFHSYPNNKEEGIRTIDRETLNLYPDNGLVRLDRGSRVYKIEGGSKRHILNVETFNAMGLDWNSITTINQYEFDSYLEKDVISINILSDADKPAGKFVEVDLKAMIVTMWEDGKIVGEVPVAGTGNPLTSPTRKGFFSVISKEDNHLSSLSHVWMPWSVRYSGNYYIHGWPYWPNGTRLTSIYSGGCVRLKDEDAKKVYDFSEVGTLVSVQ